MFEFLSLLLSFVALLMCEMFSGVCDVWCESIEEGEEKQQLVEISGKERCFS